jgi:hypothetical protein
VRLFSQGVLVMTSLVATAACSSSGDNSSSMSAAGAAGTAGENVAQAGSAMGGSGLGGASSGGGGASAAGSSGTGGTAPVGRAGTGSGGSAGASGPAGSGGTSVEPQLVPSPTELAFGAVQQTQSAPQTITLKNPSAAVVKLGSVALDPAAAGTGSFELVMGPVAGAQVAAGASESVQVRFQPNAVAEFQSALLIETTSPAAKQKVLLFGLGTKGLEGENEPFLKPVLDTLGFAINVGGPGLLSTTTPLLGDEVAAPRFKAASAAEIELIPVARYSPQEPIPYGFYVGPSETQVGVISDSQYQALNPTTDAGSKRGFAAPAGEFGIFTSSKTHKTYTEDAKNAANATKHAVRTYPLKDRAGKAIASSYLVCFEEAANGDYQDYVFTLSNVVPVSP